VETTHAYKWKYGRAATGGAQILWMVEIRGHAVGINRYSPVISSDKKKIYKR